MKRIAILHGPNLDRLGKRQPEIYGRATLKDLETLIRTEAKKLGFTTTFFQSAHEGALVDKIHALTDRGIEAFIVNFGAYSHTSIALRDAQTVRAEITGECERQETARVADQVQAVLRSSGVAARRSSRVTGGGHPRCASAARTWCAWNA